MKKLPGNVRVGPPQAPVYVAADVGDSSVVDTWIETGSISVTPPPVSVEPVTLGQERQPEGAGEQRAETDGNHQSAETGLDGRDRHSALLWPMMLVGLSVVVALILAVHPRSALQRPALQQALASLPSHWDVPEPGRSALDMTQALQGLRMQSADAHLRRKGYASIPGGVLFTPETFHSPDGAYDLLIHFHGNTRVVLQSAVAARLDAVIAVINVGVGSAPYERRYAVPGSYERLLRFINDTLEHRGLKHPRLRRVALSSWSAGYGAIATILKERRGVDPLDAIVVLDGIHTGWDSTDPSGLNTRRLAPFVRAASEAAAGDLLFTITCSQIVPQGYAGTHQTANYLLHRVEGQWGPAAELALHVPARLHLPAMRGAVAKEDVRPLVPVSNRRIGGFHVREYAGNQKGDHMSHLFQMGSTVLPELAARWSRYPQNGLRSGVTLPRLRMRHRNRAGSGKRD